MDRPRRHLSAGTEHTAPTTCPDQHLSLGPGAGASNSLKEEEEEVVEALEQVVRGVYKNTHVVLSLH